MKHNEDLIKATKIIKDLLTMVYGKENAYELIDNSDNPTKASVASMDPRVKQAEVFVNTSRY